VDVVDAYEEILIGIKLLSPDSILMLAAATLVFLAAIAGFID
jgi:hypothetical protein